MGKLKKKIPILKLDYSKEDINFILKGIEKVLKSGFLTMSDRVLEFEKAFSEFCNVKYAIGTSSGTSSLEIIMRVIDVSQGTVVMPSNTYMATPLSAIKAGAKVIFTDCNPNTLQMDPNDLKKKIRQDTKAVILVHIGGIISPEIDQIKEICDSKNIPLIEDAAHAHGSELLGKKAGSFGIAGSFSFYPTKVLNTAEGGMITTNNYEVYQRAKIFREHGKQNHAENVHVEIGDNWRYSEIHAVLGLQQMKKVNNILSQRRKIASLYDKKLTNLDYLTRLKLPSYVNPSYYKYITFLPKIFDRSKVKSLLKQNYGIELPGEVYSHPCHSQPVFHKYKNYVVNPKDDKFPSTENVCKTQLCLPVYPGLKSEEIKYIVDSIITVLDNY